MLKYWQQNGQIPWYNKTDWGCFQHKIRSSKVIICAKFLVKTVKSGSRFCYLPSNSEPTIPFHLVSLWYHLIINIWEKVKKIGALQPINSTNNLSYQINWNSSIHSETKRPPRGIQQNKRNTPCDICVMVHSPKR